MSFYMITLNVIFIQNTKFQIFIFWNNSVLTQKPVFESADFHWTHLEHIFSSQ